MVSSWHIALMFSAMSGLANAVRGKDSGPAFTAPALQAQQFLMISSPSERKVVWTTLQNFESADGRSFALIDSGLSAPKGLAFDHKKGYLYVADSGAKKIFRYTVLADTSGPSPRLHTSGVRLTIIENHPVEWVTVDESGNLFYTAPDTNNINKIKAEVLHKLANGEFKPSAMQVVSEKTLEAEERAASAMKKKLANSSDGLPRDEPEVNPHILQIYESKLNPHVSQPAAIWADGPDLYWTNQKGGTTAGTVVKGQVFPKSAPSKNGPAPFPAEALTSISAGAFGLAKSDKAIFFTRGGNLKGTGLVTGLLLGTDITIDFVRSIASPRGLVWDKEQTMYVADETMGRVWSFPTGRMMANVPITKAVAMKGAYGLVILSTDDPAFSRNEVQGGAASAALRAVTEATLARTSLVQSEAKPAASFLEYWR